VSVCACVFVLEGVVLIAVGKPSTDPPVYVCVCVIE
jgi:hypothetical protein